MPINSGVLSSAWWRVMQCSLSFCAVFVTYGQGTNVRNFLKLKSSEPPEAVQAIEEALVSERFGDVRVYRKTLGQRQLVVVGRSRNTYELLYPPSVSMGTENEFLLGANIKAERNLLSYIWNEDGGWVFLFLYPIFGVGIIYYGYMLYLTAMPDSPAAELGRGFSLAISVCGVGMALFPYVWGLFSRWRIRRALRKIGDDELNRLLKRNAEMFDGPTPSSPA